MLPERYRPLLFSTKQPQSVAAFLVDGAVAGTWRYEEGRVRWEAFERVDRATARELDCTLLLDEFYSHYVFRSPEPLMSAAAYVEDVERDPVVVFDGLTKNWRYPGWRTTWTVGAKGQTPTRLEEETVMADGPGCATVRYFQASTHLVITVRCEGVERERAPNPRAFEDPDG